MNGSKSESVHFKRGKFFTRKSATLMALSGAVASISSMSSSALGATWTGASAGAWLTNTNWNPNLVPTATDAATFADGNIATSVGINMAGVTNNGANNQIVGMIELTGGGVNRSIGNNSTSANGTLTIAGLGGLLLQNTTANSLTLQNTAGSGNKTMGVSLAAGDIDITSTGGITISSIISGSNGLTKTGSGSGGLTLSAANLYTGSTTIKAGRLTLGHATAASTGTILLGDTTGSANASLAMSGTAANVTNAITVQSGSSGTASIDAGTTSGRSFTGLMTLNKSVTLSGGNLGGFTGKITGGGAVTINPSSNVTYFGNSANDYTGGTTLNSGGTISFGTGGTGTYFGNGGTVTINGLNVNQQGSNVTINGTNAQIWNADWGTGGGGAGNFNLAMTGDIDLGATGTATTRTLTIGQTTTTVAGKINNGSNGVTTSITKAGSSTLVLSGIQAYTGGVTVAGGTLTLSNANNTYTGTTLIKSGTLNVIGGTGALGASSTDILLGDTTGSANATIAAPSTTGATISRNITVQAGNSGTATISAAANGGFPTQNFSGTITLGSGGVAKGVTLNAGQYNSLTVSGLIRDAAGISGTGGLVTISGNYNVTISNSNTFTGGVTVAGGQLKIGHNNALGTGTLTINGGSVGGYNFTISNPQVWAGNWNTIGASSAFSSTGSVLLSGGSRTVTIDNSSISIGGVISDDGNGYGITYQSGTNGGNSLTLNGANTFGGGLLILGNTTVMNVGAGNASALGSGQARLSTRSTSKLTLNTALTVDSLSSAITAPTITAGTGGTNGTQTLTITDSGGTGSGAAGTATVSGGIVTAVTITDYGRNFSGVPIFSIPAGGTNSINGSFAASSVVLGANTLTIAGTNASPATYSGALSGTNGSVVKNGSGSQTFTGANTYTGSTSVTDGTLAIAGSGSINSTSGIQINGAGAVFQYDSSTALTKAVAFGGSGGKFTYNSAAAYAGGALSVGNNATLGGSGVIGSNVSVASGGTIAPGNSPGTLTINGTLGLAGSTAIEIASASSYDKITGVSGYTFGGTLDIALGYTPTAPATFNLFDGPSDADNIISTGGFTNLNSLPALGSGLVWNTDDLYTFGKLSIESLGNPVSLTGAVPDGSSVADSINPFGKSGPVIAVSGTNGSYTSEIDDLIANTAVGSANIDAVGLEGSIYVMLRLVDGSNQLTELQNPIVGAAVVDSNDPQYQALFAQYGGFFNELLRFDSPTANGAFNFDFSSDPSGAVVDRIAVVPEPGAIGMLSVGAIGLISQRRRRKQV